MNTHNTHLKTRATRTNASTKDQRRMAEVTHTLSKLSTNENAKAKRASRRSRQRARKLDSLSMGRITSGSNAIAGGRAIVKDVPMKTGGNSINDLIAKCVLAVASPFNAPSVKDAAMTPVDTSARLPSVDAEPTAISNSWGWYSAAFGQSSQPAPSPDQGGNYTSPFVSYGFVWRDPIRHSVTNQAVSQPFSYQYSFEADSSGGFTSAAPQPTQNPTYALTPEQEYFLPVAFAQSLTGQAIHGNRIYPGTSDQFNPAARFIWAEPGVSINIVYNNVGSSSGAVFAFNMYRFAGGQVQLATGYSGTGGNINFPILQCGYYGFSVIMESQPGPPNSGSVQISGMIYSFTSPITANGVATYPYTLWAHRALPQYEQLAQSMEDCRIVGSGLLFQNDTASAYAGGICTSAVLTSDRHWTDIALAGPNSLKQMKRALVLQQNAVATGETGARVIVKPINYDSFDFKAQFEVSLQSGFKRAWFNLHTEENFGAICYDVSGSAATGAPANVGQWHPAANVEYHTEDITRHVGYADLSYETQSTLIEALKVPPALGFNGSHVSDVFDAIENFLDRGIGLAGKYLPLVSAFL